MQRAVLAFLVLLTVTAPGCFGPEGAPRPPAAGVQEDAPSADRPEGMAEGPAEVPAPALPKGRAWTYRAEELYSDDPELTVVVAEAGPEGYLFAGGTPDDLVYPALWGSLWFGPYDRDLNRADWYLTLFDFPLADGKTWTLLEGLEVRASAADVATPSGMEAGFVIEGAAEGRTIRYEYAPSIGFVTTFHHEWSRGFDRLELVAIEENRTGVWYELGPLTATGNPHEPQAAEVPEGYDAVLVSAGGTHEAEATVVGPDGEAHRFAFSGEETWTNAILEPTAGQWTVSVQGRPWIPDAPSPPYPMGWAYVHFAPVRWIDVG